MSSTEQNPLTDEQRKALLDSLSFDDMKSRFESIEHAYKETCQWLAATPEYLDWWEPQKFHKHHGFLWIKGHPGTGKSTIMKVALEGISKLNSIQCISFFFHARGTDLQKSTTGMYRSLLWQLVKKLPHLQSVFNSLEWTVHNGTMPRWQIPLLKSLFKQAVQDLNQSSVICFIDALDEGDDEQVRDMVSFFEELGDMAASNDISFRICLSSRHYPYIKIPKSLSLELEKQTGHGEDILNYINGKLRIENINLAQEVRDELIKKANGVFMWVVLVVPILQKEYDHGHPERLLQRLKDLPKKLHDLFRRILTRDSRHKAELLLCIQWVLFARKPLRKDELYLAVRTGMDESTISNWNSEGISESDMRRYILSSSKGLIEINTSRTNPTAQFIHESVREFFLREDLSQIWPKLKRNFQGRSHERLKQCCDKYMKIGAAYLAEDDYLPRSTRSNPNRAPTEEKFPFLKYASQNILYHAEEAAATGIGQAYFLHKFDLNGWIECKIKFEQLISRQYSRNKSLLYILAELNAGNLISCYEGRLGGFDEEDAPPYGMPILAAIELNNRQAVHALLKAQADTQPSSSPLHALCEQYSQIEQRRDTPSRIIPWCSFSTLLLKFFHAGDDIVLAFLLAAPAKLMSSVKRNTEAKGDLLRAAAASGLERLIQELLNQGLNVDEPSKWKNTALHCAVSENQENIVQLLLDRGADIEKAGRQGNTPMHEAAKRGHECMVRLLLERGANIDSRNKKNQTPLHCAALESSVDTAQLLIDGGADMEAVGNDGYTPLALAANARDTPVMQLLTSRGANTDVAYSSEYILSELLRVDTSVSPELKSDISRLLNRRCPRTYITDRNSSLFYLNSLLYLTRSLSDDHPVRNMILDMANDEDDNT